MRVDGLCRTALGRRTIEQGAQLGGGLVGQTADALEADGAFETAVDDVLQGLFSPRRLRQVSALSRLPGTATSKRIGVASTCTGLAPHPPEPSIAQSS